MFQKDIERFEIFGVDGKWLIKDNKEQPHLLDCYQSCVRLNEFAVRIAELEEQLKNMTPKFKYHQVVYVLCDSDIIKGQIDCFDYYNKKYLIWTMEFGLGNEWCYEHELFATKEDALAKLEELKGENK